MGEQNKRKRNEFTKSLEVKGNSNSKIVHINARREIYNAPKDTMKNVSKSQKAKRKRNVIRNRLLALGMAGVLAFGGYQAYKAYNENNNTITLEQAVENGIDIDELGIDTQIQEKIYELQEKIGQENLTNEELINLADEINSVQFDTVKSKLANVLETDTSKIQVWTSDAGEGKTVEKVMVKDGEIYVTKDFFDNENTISNDVSKFIREIGEMQIFTSNINTQDIDRDKVINQYEKVLENVSKFAATQMEIDEKGNISVEKTKETELEQQKIEQAKIQKDDEMEI